MKKLLVICPSRQRVNKLMNMIYDFGRTTNPDHTDLVILLDKDDPDVGMYFEKIPLDIKIEIYDRSSDCTLTTEIINRAFHKYKDQYEYFSVTNDDIHYMTNGWDEALCQPLKISSGQDDTMVEKYGDRMIGNVNPGEFPITSVIDGRIVNAIGWLQYPYLKHSCGDNIWFWVGKRAKCLYHDGRYHTEHRSPYFNKTEVDETFKKSNAYECMEDYYTYKEWLKYKCGKEVMKVIKLIEETEKCQKEIQAQST